MGVFTAASVGSRGRAAELSAAVERSVVKQVAGHPGISVAQVRKELEPRLTPAQRSLLQLAIYNLINDKRLELTAKRTLKIAGT